MSALRSRIEEDIVRAYGSTEHPSYEFAEERYRANPYVGLLKDLAKAYTLTETTDLNDDVAVTLVLTSAEATFGLRLSLVGRYAAVSYPNGHILDESEFAATKSPSHLLSFLMRNNIEVLGRSELVAPIHFGEARQSAPLYEVLFSTDEAVFLRVGRERDKGLPPG